MYERVSGVMEERAFSRLQEGLLVLADISGYTAFVTQTEVDHSWEILHELLDVMVRSAEGKLEVSQVEGDAILFISGLDAEDVVKAVESTFVGFHRRRRDMVAVTTCPCNACKNVGILTLKFVIHHGQFSRQRLGGVEQLHGSDVIVPHRLVKNRVPIKEYLLATEAALSRLSEERQMRFTPYEETYDLGVVKAGYESLAYLWEQDLAGERTEVRADEAHHRQSGHRRSADRIGQRTDTAPRGDPALHDSQQGGVLRGRRPGRRRGKRVPLPPRIWGQFPAGGVHRKRASADVRQHRRRGRVVPHHADGKRRAEQDRHKAAVVVGAAGGREAGGEHKGGGAGGGDSGR